MKRVLRACWRSMPAPLRHWLGGTLGGGSRRALRDVVNRAMDRRYGVTTIKPQLPPAVHTHFDDALPSVPSHYFRLLVLRRALSLGPGDVFADLGCGGGRVLFVFAHSACRLVRGIELDPIAIGECEANIARFRGPAGKIEVLHADCADFRFTDETVLHFYNPFGPDTLRAVLKNLRSSLERNPRRVRLCYRGHFAAVIDSEAPWLRVTKAISFRAPRMLIYETV